MKDWFNRLDPRERRMVISGGISLLLLMLYVLAWEPIVTSRTQLQERVPQQQELLGWMQSASVKVKTLRAGGANPVGTGGKTLLGIIDQSARTGALADKVKRMDPQGDDSVRITLEQVNFDRMIQWLGQLSRQYGVVTKTVNIDQQPQQGLVNVRITLTSAGSS